ncbi:MAG: ATP-binding protein [Acidovorax sp.]|nr:ATP-binding protein [Acidovorax sp.]
MKAGDPRPAGSARRAETRARAVRWGLGLGTGLMCAIALVLLFLLTLATNNRDLYERNFAWLLGVNVLVALVLLAVLVWGALRLVVRLRRGRFGSRLLLKLAGIFGLVGVIPGLLIYVVSYQFVSRSIESWFDVKVEGALTAGVSLARVTLDTIASDLASKTRTASSQLAQVPDAAAGLVLERMRDQLGATDLVLWNAAGQPVAGTGQSRYMLNPERPSAQQFRMARQDRVTFQIEGLDDITDPLAAENARVRALVLADGVREVAAGNLSPKAALQTKDELGGLTRSFALMTQQLADARGTVEQSLSALDAARGHLQTILDNLTSGVIVLDEKGIVQSSNPGATRVLRAPLAAYEGRPLAEVPGLADFAAAVQRHFDTFLLDRDHHGLDHWQQTFELHAAGGGVTTQGTSLVARGAQLPNEARLLVFDDISEIVSAQRAQAWGEVARRLAHEIKNPLTPIQLSAERLEIKLSGKLPAAEQAVLTKSVKTIVDQVDAMKRLVNEFRDYARLPSAELHTLDLNALVADVLHLYGAETAQVPVEAELDPRCPAISGDAQQLRQVVHNLLQNAQDATQQAAEQGGVPPPPVRISTRWSESAQRVRLTVSDCGPGFPPHILQRAFEPYVTTKPRGTGLGLAVVKKIADEHRARIDLVNRVEDGVVKGAQVSLSFAPESAVAL